MEIKKEDIKIGYGFGDKYSILITKENLQCTFNII